MGNLKGCSELRQVTSKGVVSLGPMGILFGSFGKLGQVKPKQKFVQEPTYNKKEKGGNIEVVVVGTVASPPSIF